MSARIIFFKDISKTQLDLVGGKGVNLGIMTNAGIPVPNGFCVTSRVYKDFISQNSLAPFLKDNFNGEQIRARFIQSALPGYLENEIATALKQFEADSYFGVRSSATAEDLPFASFAGQQDTYLNITGLTNILDAIKNCWASLYTDRAIAYRQKQGISSDQVYMSVVVQKMVMSEMSGIMFTADPVSENRQIISIDAGFGLGEALVSGIVSPDIYKYDKRTGRISDKLISKKEIAIYPINSGGTNRVKLDGVKASSQVLEDNIILRLADIGRKIEDYYKSPQDIEWCIEKGEIFIVQSRAITSLFPLPEPSKEDGRLHPYASLNHVQMMLAPITPMGIDILRMFFRNTRVPFEEYKSTLIKQAAGRIYIDLSRLLQYRLIRKPFLKIIGNVDLLISEACLSLVMRKDFGRRIAKKWSAVLTFLRFVHTLPPKILKTIIFADTKGAAKRLDEFAEKTIMATAERIGKSDSLHDKIRAIYDNLNMFKYIILNIAPTLLPGLVSMKLLEAMEKKLFGTNKYSGEVIKGLEGNVTTEMGLLVGDLADYVRKSDLLRREFENNDYGSFFARIDKLEGEIEFKRLFKRFMEKYGVRSAGEIDIATERWAENPEPFINSVIAMADGMTQGQHRREFAETKKEALAAVDEFVNKIAQEHGERKAKKVAKLIKIARDCLPVRELPKFIMMHIFYAAKKALLAEADKLAARGEINNRQDIFMLGIWELDRLSARGGELKKIIAERKSEYRRFREITPPRLITSDGEIVKATYNKKDLPADAIVGVGVSSGVVEGIARVILDPTGAEIKKGEILVAPYTDPGWTTLFINAAGLVTEVGGLLTHGTVVAREYGIPAVVGCENATTQIRTGQKIKIDGNNGFVIIEEE